MLTEVGLLESPDLTTYFFVGFDENRSLQNQD
jgi:hypothetical protein